MKTNKELLQGFEAWGKIMDEKKEKWMKTNF